MYAVITGDIVEFTKLNSEGRDRLLEILKRSFVRIRELHADAGDVSFDLFRGDSFQGVLPDPREALRAMLLIRSMIRSGQPTSSPVTWDTRLAAGIGTVEKLPKRPTEGDGEAYRRSGPALDEMSRKSRLALRTPWDSVDAEFGVSLALMDAVIAKWSPKQAEMVVELLRQKNRKEIAESFNISQSAITYRVQGAGWFAVDKLLKRYRKLIGMQLSNGS